MRRNKFEIKKKTELYNTSSCKTLINTLATARRVVAASQLAY